MQTITTFSIVAYDPVRKEWGVAVQSKFLAVAAVVSWAKAGAGAVATQARANLTYGPRALELMSIGTSAEDAITALTAGDRGKTVRQVGAVDKEGNAFAFTGSELID